MASPAIGGALRPMDIDELSPDMGHAGDLADGAGAVEILEPGITVGVHPAAEAGEVVLWDAGPCGHRRSDTMPPVGACRPKGRSSRA